MTRHDASPDDIYVCAVCGRVLDKHSLLGWRHNFADANADHPAVPVPRGQVPTRGRCDFCSVDDPEWIVPATDFEVMAGHISTSDWGACDACAKLIENDDWDGVINRVATMYKKLNKQPMPRKIRNSVTILYRLLAEHRDGPLRRAGSIYDPRP